MWNYKTRWHMSAMWEIKHNSHISLEIRHLHICCNSALAWICIPLLSKAKPAFNVLSLLEEYIHHHLLTIEQGPWAPYTAYQGFILNTYQLIRTVILIISSTSKSFSKYIFSSPWVSRWMNQVDKWMNWRMGKQFALSTIEKNICPVCTKALSVST